MESVAYSNHHTALEDAASETAGKAVVSLRRTRELARGVAQRLSGPSAIALARAFTASLLRSYWHALQRNAKPIFYFVHPPDDLDYTDLDLTLEGLAEISGRQAATIEPLEAGYLIGAIYAAMLPADFRSRNGVYYTPPSVSLRLIEIASTAGIDWSRGRILDPACGGGAFLAPLAARIVEHLPDCEPTILLQNLASRLRGFEIDAFAAWMSQVLLDASLLGLYRRTGERLPKLVDVCNALDWADAGASYDLVIGNPPYGRINLPAAARKCFARSLYGHANLYGVFTDLALRWVKPGGVIAYVTPTSFLGGEYYKNLRRLLAADAPPVHVEFISARKGVFDEVLQETLLATYRRGATLKRPSVAFLLAKEDTKAEARPGGTFNLPSSGTAPWILPRKREQRDLVDRLLRMPHRLKDYGYAVSTGPLVWNRHKAQLRKASNGKTLPLIWAESVTSVGAFCFRAEKRNHVPWFELNRGDEWLVTSDACVLVQRTTAKEQRRRLIAAELPQRFLDGHGGAVVENHLNMVRCQSRPPRIPPSVIVALLNSPIVDAAFRCISGSVAVSASELEALPLPDPEAAGDLAIWLREGHDRTSVETKIETLYREIAR